jgi:hypothetical protein
MENRTLQLISIRPEISIETGKASVYELFQSQTLRPILKFQNEIILAAFKNYLDDVKIKFQDLTDEKKEACIHQTMKKNLALKNTMLGFIIGHFTSDEYIIYSQQKAEFNKRIVEMLIKRISDQKEKLF